MTTDYTGHAISFVIPALNEELLIGRCINAIKREIERYPGLAAEIIVVDNRSSDATVCVAAVKGARVEIEKQRGIQSAKARGLKVAKYPIIATIDADCMIREGWIARVIDTFNDPTIAAVSGPYRYYDIKFIGRYLTNLVFAGMSVLGQRTPMMMGGNSAFRRSDLISAGGFNPDFKFWGEDTEVAQRVSKIGRIKFDIRLRVDSSGRRLIEQGYVSTAWTYLINHLSVRFYGRAASDKHMDIR